MRGAIAVLRRFVGRQPPCLAGRPSSIGDDLIVSSAVSSASYSTPILAAVGARPPFAFAFSQFLSNQKRNFSSPPSSGNAVSKPNIHAVPKPPLFKNGRNAGKGQGAGVERLRNSYSPGQFPMNRRRNKKLRKIDLPTNYLEVNYKIGKAIMFYGPNIAHIPRRVDMKDLNLLGLSEHERRYK